MVVCRFSTDGETGAPVASRAADRWWDLEFWCFQSFPSSLQPPSGGSRGAGGDVCPRQAARWMRGRQISQGPDGKHLGLGERQFLPLFCQLRRCHPKATRPSTTWPCCHKALFTKTGGQGPSKL